MILSIIFALIGGFIAYCLLEDDKPVPLMVFYFGLGLLKQYFSTGMSHILFYVIFYLIYSVLIVLILKVAYGRSKSFMGFVFEACLLSLIVNGIMVLITVSLVKLPFLKLFLGFGL